MSAISKMCYHSDYIDEKVYYIIIIKIANEKLRDKYQIKCFLSEYVTTLIIFMRKYIYL